MSNPYGLPPPLGPGSQRVSISTSAAPNVDANDASRQNPPISPITMSKPGYSPSPSLAPVYQPSYLNNAPTQLSVFPGGTLLNSAPGISPKRVAPMQSPRVSPRPQYPENCTQVTLIIFCPALFFIFFRGHVRDTWR